jgi:hypothetical protein
MIQWHLKYGNDVIKISVVNLFINSEPFAKL